MSENIKHTTIEQELENGNSVTYFTKGVSMNPLLYEKKTHVTIFPASEVKNGDIVLYIRSNGALVLHRCIKQKNGIYYMRGDNTYGLEPIKKEQAIGVATIIYRNGKSFGVDKRSYRVYVALWRIIYPFRFMWQYIKRAARKMVRIIKN